MLLFKMMVLLFQTFVIAPTSDMHPIVLYRITYSLFQICVQALDTRDDTVDTATEGFSKTLITSPLPTILSI